MQLLLTNCFTVINIKLMGPYLDEYDYEDMNAFCEKYPENSNCYGEPTVQEGVIDKLVILLVVAFVVIAYLISERKKT